MQVKEIMTKEVVTARSSDSLKEIARKMMAHNIGAVPICDEDQRLQGILTDRTIALCVAAEGMDPEDTSAIEVMEQITVSTEAEADFETALQMMRQAHVKRIPVLEQGKIVGMLSSVDLAESLRKHLDQLLGIEGIYRQ
jgi:CBS domain-containing protein